MVREEKTLELFCKKCVKPHPSRCNGAIVRKVVIFLKKVQLFCRQLGRSKEKKVFAVWEASLKPGGSCGVWEMGFGERAVAS